MQQPKLCDWEGCTELRQPKSRFCVPHHAANARERRANKRERKEAERQADAEANREALRQAREQAAQERILRRGVITDEQWSTVMATAINVLLDLSADRDVQAVHNRQSETVPPSVRRAAASDLLKYGAQFRSGALPDDLKELATLIDVPPVDIPDGDVL